MLSNSSSHLGGDGLSWFSNMTFLGDGDLLGESNFFRIDFFIPLFFSADSYSMLCSTLTCKPALISSMLHLGLSQTLFLRLIKLLDKYVFQVSWFSLLSLNKLFFHGDGLSKKLVCYHCYPDEPNLSLCPRYLSSRLLNLFHSKGFSWIVFLCSYVLHSIPPELLKFGAGLHVDTPYSGSLEVRAWCFDCLADLPVGNMFWMELFKSALRS